MSEKKVREAIEGLKAEIRIYNSMIKENKDFSSLCVRLKIKIERYTTAIKALEKQLPKNPIEHSAKFAPLYECPSCGNVDVYGQRKCDHCGQELDWPKQIHDNEEEK